MDVYLVGGAVRDELLGVPVTERDWVVVGSTPEAMLDAGFRQVGRDFPVFLHPDTHEEYALARTERKVGSGHTGFVCHAGPEVTLEEDLARRDLTINAMARAGSDVLVDPYGGQDDLTSGILRHVSAAFAEDPLRVFRVARFAARMPAFVVAPETLELLRSMRGELDELAAERVFIEFRKALDATAPERFLEVLKDADCLAPWFVELTDVVQLPGHDARSRFGLLATRLDERALHALSKRLKVPNDFRQLAEHVRRHGEVLTGWRQARAEQIMDAAQDVVLRAGPEWLDVVVGTLASLPSSDPDDLRVLAAELNQLSQVGEASTFVAAGLQGPEIGAAVRAERVAYLRQALQVE